MKLINLRDKVNNGYHPVVRFKKRIEDMDTYFEEFMVGRIINVSHSVDDTFFFVFCVEEYNDYNAAYESANYYNNHGEACLTATEANMHPCRNHMMEDVCFTTTDRVEDWFEIVSDDGTELFERDAAGRTDSTNYVEWLEAKVVELKNKVASLIEK